MFKHSVRITTLSASLAAAFAVSACNKDKGESAGKASDSLALTSPTLCKHAMSLDESLEEMSCIMRLDGLQIQLGDDWEQHGTCIAKAAGQADYKACLSAADTFSLEKSKRQ